MRLVASVVNGSKREPRLRGSLPTRARWRLRLTRLRTWKPPKAWRGIGGNAFESLLRGGMPQIGRSHGAASDTIEIARIREEKHESTLRPLGARWSGKSRLEGNHTGRCRVGDLERVPDSFPEQTRNAETPMCEPSVADNLPIDSRSVEPMH